LTRALESRKYVAISTTLAKDGLGNRLTLDRNWLPLISCPAPPLGVRELTDSARLEQVLPELFVGHRRACGRRLGTNPRMLLADPGQDLADHVFSAGISATPDLIADEAIQILANLDIHRSIPPSPA
jgi:hypothetical protein